MQGSRTRARLGVVGRAIVLLGMAWGCCLPVLAARPSARPPPSCPAHAVTAARTLNDAVHALACLGRTHELIVVGDLHGTDQIPDFVGDLVRTVSARRPVRLGLEMPAFMQGAVDAYVRSGGRAADRKALLQQPFWNGDDGRQSRAMLGLIERVRKLRADGRRIRVFLMVPNLADPSVLKRPGGFLAFKEAGMARSIRSQLTEGGGKAQVIAYMGNWHSRYDSGKAAAQGSTVERLADVRPVVVDPDGRGAAWVCMADGCGVHHVGARTASTLHKARMRKVPDPTGRVYEVHVRMPALTASLPAKPQAKAHAGERNKTRARE